MTAPKFTIKHVGINTKSEAAAEALLNEALTLFGLERGNENEAHVFAGSLFEIMKGESIGKNGHIALQTPDVEYAIAFFAENGIGIQESTVRKDEAGKIIFAYLDIELGGFAFHLTI